ncbi:DUF4404 family protein [Fastidiosibacter lacustris]|uniref:DUF4404 family protein n=1 Tax=Fastidiosibacter lacustris TaxID=2056695 RepID=UPI000E34D96A|nr:DUF4404 family protein [Fastidiosibacter lacustris]
MLKDTIAQIKQLLQNTGKLNFVDTEALSELLDQLQSELATFPKDQQAQAIEIAKLTKQKIEMSKLQDPKEADFSDLEQVVMEYEITHPRLTDTIRSICNLLSSIGI